MSSASATGAPDLATQKNTRPNARAAGTARHAMALTPSGSPSATPPHTSTERATPRTRNYEPRLTRDASTARGDGSVRRVTAPARRQPHSRRPHLPVDPHEARCQQVRPDRVLRGWRQRASLKLPERDIFVVIQAMRAGYDRRLRSWLYQPPDNEHENDDHEDADKAIARAGKSEGDCSGHFQVSLRGFAGASVVPDGACYPLREPSHTSMAFRDAERRPGCWHACAWHLRRGRLQEEVNF